MFDDAVEMAVSVEGKGLELYPNIIAHGDERDIPVENECLHKKLTAGTSVITGSPGSATSPMVVALIALMMASTGAVRVYKLARASAFSRISIRVAMIDSASESSPAAEAIRSILTPHFKIRGKKPGESGWIMTCPRAI